MVNDGDAYGGGIVFPKPSAQTFRDRLRHRGMVGRHSIEPAILGAHEIVAPMVPRMVMPGVGGRAVV
jgi:hypothetical protein